MQGSMEESRGCAPEPCKWVPWTDWSTCSTTCGPGQAMRVRMSEWPEAMDIPTIKKTLLVFSSFVDETFWTSVCRKNRNYYGR
eukprot:5938483-Amphidinium_carterae.1